MPARNVIHDAVKNALVKDGWTITDDPYRIEYKGARLYADLAAERSLAAERGGEQIIVEITSFLGPSPWHELQGAVGQYQIYRSLLRQTAPDRRLFLAVSDTVYTGVFQQSAVKYIVEDCQVCMLVVDVEKEGILTWINWPGTGTSSDST